MPAASSRSSSTLPDTTVYCKCKFGKEDVTLHHDDINALTRANDSSGWLTDDLILFWELWLTENHIKRRGCKIELMAPSVSLLLRRGQYDGDKDPKDTTHIFLPINDTEDYDRAESGMHWSLLLVSLKDRVAFHYDSCRSLNEKHARATVDRLNDHVAWKKQNHEKIQFIEITNHPQQTNGSDCGVMVCVAMKRLTLKLLSCRVGDMVDMTVPDTVDTDVARKRFMELIDKVHESQK